MGFQYLNDEQKVRISLSRKAYLTMTDDMSVFDVKTQSLFINKLIENYKEDSKASISAYLEKKKAQFYHEIISLDYDSDIKENILSHLCANEKKRTIAYLESLMKEKEVSKIYHLNNTNTDYLSLDFEDNEFYKEKPGLYIKCMLEEYASLPFIEREKIYRKEIYEIVENACNNHLLLSVRIPIFGERKTLIIYPYKILPDEMNTQDYFACYTRFREESPKEKISASFSMARLPMPTIYKQNAFLSKEDIHTIEEDIRKLSISFLRGQSSEIHVKLTETGKRTFHNKLYSRPFKEESLSTEDEYVFFCSETKHFTISILLGRMQKLFPLYH